MKQLILSDSFHIDNYFQKNVIYLCKCQNINYLVNYILNSIAVNPIPGKTFSACS